MSAYRTALVLLPLALLLSAGVAFGAVLHTCARVAVVPSVEIEMPRTGSLGPTDVRITGPVGLGAHVSVLPLTADGAGIAAAPRDRFLRHGADGRLPLPAPALPIGMGLGVGDGAPPAQILIRVEYE